MFRDSLLETSQLTRARRGWATLASFFLETAAIGLLVLVPLIYTDALPSLRFSEPVPPPPGRRPSVPKERVTNLEPVPDSLRPHVLEEPRTIPTSIDMTADRRARSAAGDAEVAPPCVVCVDGGVGDLADSRTNTIANLLPRQDFHPSLPPPRVTTLKVSRMEPGMLLTRVEPKYPPIAVQTRTRGEVVLTAVIGRDGRIENLHVVTGHPLLVGAALDAVRQWRYRPTILNGTPVEVETQITVNFKLDR